MADLTEKQLKTIITIAHKTAKDKTKDAISEIIKRKEAEFYDIGQSSFMHYSAHDVFLILQEINEQIKTI